MRIEGARGLAHAGPQRAAGRRSGTPPIKLAVTKNRVLSPPAQNGTPIPCPVPSRHHPQIFTDTHLTRQSEYIFVFRAVLSLPKGLLRRDPVDASETPRADTSSPNPRCFGSRFKWRALPCAIGWKSGSGGCSSVPRESSPIVLALLIVTRCPCDVPIVMGDTMTRKYLTCGKLRKKLSDCSCADDLLSQTPCVD